MPTARDEDRVERIRRFLDENDLDAIACALPSHVLLFSGYWPVVGNALALASRSGRIAIIAPKDERELAEEGWADELLGFQPVTPEELPTLAEVLRDPLAEASRVLGVDRGRIGFEQGPFLVPAPYAAMSVYGSALPEILRQALPEARLTPVAEPLRRFEAVKTPGELERIRRTCRLAERVFREGAERLRPGLLETEAAEFFHAPLARLGPGFEGAGRGGGFAWCMSGPNAAEAQGAYARSRPRPLQAGELVLVHCNAFLDGFWIDVTRTFCLGMPDKRQGELFDAVLKARAAALAAIRPGVPAAEVDRAARGVLENHGFGRQFKHPVGHGASLHAIDHQARPWLHQKSDDVLEAGMVCNLEPAVYFDGDCGLRHCEMVAVTADGQEVLTPFQATIDQLIAHGGGEGGSGS